MTTPKRVLTVAGSDSGGGAGIEADLRTFALLGCHGSAAITAVTAQNSLGVQGVYPMAPEAVEAQIESVLSDIGADAAKTGMLFSSDIIRSVAGALGRRPVERLVLDPVMVAKGGAALLRDDARQTLIHDLLPLALLVTPNLPEAEALAGVRIASDAARREACRRILDMGPTAVLLKGGHGEGDVVEDIYADRGGSWHVLRVQRWESPNTHGTGCTLSAAIAANLALGFSLTEAVLRAHAFLQVAIREGYALGSGHGPTNPMAAARLGGHNEVLERLRAAWDLLEAANPAGLIPEVQSNLAEALPWAGGFDEIAAFPGRIVRCGERIRRVDGPRFGSSRHMAKILLASARHGSPFRAVMNIRYGSDVLDACQRSGLSAERFDRAEEPEEVQRAEGSTLEWGTETVLRRCSQPPDVIFDQGGQGKEPMVRVFGRDAVEVARKVVEVFRSIRN